MTPIHILVMAFLSQPEALVPVDTAWSLVQIASDVERSFRLPEALISATVLAESGGRNTVAYPRAGGCDVGPGQVHLKHCDGHARWYLSASSRINLTATGWLLNRSRKICSSPRRKRANGKGWISPPLACQRCPWALYNARSKTWCKKVMHILKRLRFYPDQPERSS